MTVAILLTSSWAGCSSKKQLDAGAVGGPAGLPTIETSPSTWEYDAAPAPPFEGSADRRLMSFVFEEGSTRLDNEAMGACREAAKKYKEDPEMKLAAIGFADALKETGDAVGLGLKRAEAARGALVSLGIPGERIHAASFGSRYAKARDWEKIQLAQDRKVEIWILK